MWISLSRRGTIGEEQSEKMNVDLTFSGGRGEMLGKHWGGISLIVEIKIEETEIIRKSS